VEEAGSELRIAGRFRGPPGAANGGLASGSLAARLAGTVHVEVTLRRPVPLERPLGVCRDGDDVLVLEDHGQLLAEARPPAAEAELTAPDHPTPRKTRAAAGLSAYYAADPLFPDCFVCGPARAPGDGLTDCGSCLVRCPGARCGRRRGRRTSRSAVPTARSGTRWSGRRSTAPAGWLRRRRPRCPPTASFCWGR
jgi:hypothetical protein